jgi:small subunit ribosomal protein S11e
VTRLPSASAGPSARPYVEESHTNWNGRCRVLTGRQVRFNVLRVLPRTGKAVKSFQKF